MGTEFYAKPAVPYDRALMLLAGSGKAIVELPERAFMLELDTQRVVRSLDRSCGVQMAKASRDTVDEQIGLQPRGSVWFFKFWPYTERGRQFAVLVADIIGAEDLLTYYGLSVRQKDEMDYEFGGSE